MMAAADDTERAMNGTMKLTGRVISAARALSGVGQRELAAVAGVSVETLREMEAIGSAWVPSPELSEAINRALEHFGVLVLPEADGFGAGVRLKFTRQDVKQMVRLESEGGTIGSDDAP
jgi:transcriptional regulator with XRE-family HTH domain